jgi:prophage regulatory protein
VVSNAQSENHDNDRLMRLPEVQRETGLGRTTIYRLMNAGKFPRSVQLTPKCVSWWEREVREWKQKLPRTQRAFERVSAPGGNQQSPTETAA